MSHWFDKIIDFGGRAVPTPVAELGRSADDAMSKMTVSLLSSIMLLSVSFALTSCTPPSSTTAQPDQQTQAKLRNLERRLEEQAAAAARFQQTTTESLEKKITTMGQSLADLFSTLEGDVRGQVSTLRQSLYREKTAVLDPASKGYSYVSTDKGVFLFAVDGAEPFLDGHKILLRVGNPMNMTFSGFKLKVRYGKRPPAFPSFETGETNTAIFKKWGDDQQAWEKTVRKTDISFTDTLEPGAWNKIDFTLKETKPEDVAYIEVGIETDQVALRKPLRDLK